MKKLVLLLAVVFSVSLFSCGNAKSEAAATDTVDSAAVVVEEVVTVDSVSADTTVKADTVAAPVKK